MKTKISYTKSKISANYGMLVHMAVCTLLATVCCMHLLYRSSAWIFCTSVQMGLWLWLLPLTLLNNFTAFLKCPLTPVNIHWVY